MALLDPALGNPTLDQLRSVFLRAGYTAEAVGERLRVSGELRVRDADIALHRRRLTAGDDLDGRTRVVRVFRPATSSASQRQSLAG